MNTCRGRRGKPLERTRVARPEAAGDGGNTMNGPEAKTSRVIAALEHRETDRVPIGEFFWTNFIRRAKQDLGVGDDFNPYTYWDLDMVVLNPNMDPHIENVQVVEASADHKVVRTGFEATIELKGTYPMPRYVDFDTKTYEDMEACLLYTSRCV